MNFHRIDPNTKGYADALQLRQEILRLPLGLTFTAAETAHDAEDFHFGAFEGSLLVAILILQPIDGDKIKMRQVAVSPDFQGHGIGSKLVAFAEEFAQQQGYRTLVAHARTTALTFYQRLGYTATGEEFLEVTIPHWSIIKILRKEENLRK